MPDSYFNTIVEDFEFSPIDDRNKEDDVIAEGKWVPKWRKSKPYNDNDYEMIGMTFDWKKAGHDDKQLFGHR